MTDRTLNTLGLALRSGSLAVGEEPAAEACKSKRARVLLVASDAAGNTARKAGWLAESCSIPLVTLPYDKSQVGFHLGRSVCALLAVTDAGFAASLMKRLAEADPERYGVLAEELDGKAKRTQQRKKARALERQQEQSGQKKSGGPAGRSKRETK